MYEIAMDQRLVWNQKRLKEIDEAKKLYIRFKRLGHVITLSDKKTIIQRFNPALEEIIVLVKKVTKHEMKILTPEGDERVVWDKDNGYEAKQAKKRFNDLINQGYKAFSVNPSGNKNRKIIEFDVDAEEILLIPETVKR